MVESITQSVTLTDDELVGISMGAGQAWRSPLPTVDISSETALLDAGRRGRRSLTARGLLARPGEGEQAAPTPLQRLLAPALRASSPTVMFAADEAGNWLVADTTLAAHPPIAASSEWLLEGVTGDGLHVFELGSGESVLSTYLSFANNAFAGGGSSAAPAGASAKRPWLSFVSQDPSRRTLRVGKGVVEWVLTTDDGTAYGLPQAVTDMREALAGLLRVG
jgi:hypothetical protein